MIGTLVGLINMLKNLNLSEGGSDAIGVNMSTALVTTLYLSLIHISQNPDAALKFKFQSNFEGFIAQMKAGGTAMEDFAPALFERLRSMTTEMCIRDRYWDPYARGAVLGLTRGANKKHLVRATLESMAYQTKDLIDAMTEDLGGSLAALKVDGGASANNFLCLLYTSRCV